MPPGFPHFCTTCRRLAFLLLLLASSAAADDDWSTDQWLLPQATQPTTIGMSYSGDPQATQTLGAYLIAPLGAEAGIDLSWSQTRLQDSNGQFDSQDLGARLNGRFREWLDLSIGYRFQGQTNVLELEHYSLGLRYHSDPASVELEYRDGSVSVYARQDIPAITRFYPQQAKSDLHAWLIQFTLHRGTADFYLSWLGYAYDRDPALLGRSRLLQQIAAPGVIEQSDLLIDQQTRIGVSHYGDRLDSNLEWARSQNAVDQSSSDSLQLDMRYRLDRPQAVDNEIRLLFGIGHSFDAADPWSLLAGLEWTGY